MILISMPDMARARTALLFPEAAPKTLLQPRRQRRGARRPAVPGVLPQTGRRLGVLLV
ncbi:MAG: hypothetical protein NTX87_15660 [Planctomycetota bacterium]|nr:hypothetical protein [Planctomycetota bacterium]